MAPSSDRLGRGPLARIRAAVVKDGTWRYYLGFWVGRMSGFVVLPALSRILGVSGFGRFEPALAALMASTIVVDAGLAAALVRFVGDQRFDENSLLVGAARLQSRASAAAVLLFGPLVVLFAPSGTVSVALGTLCVFAFVEGLAGIGSGYCRATQRDGMYLALSGVRFATTIVATLAGAAVAGTGGALVGIALSGVGFAGYAVARIFKARAHFVKPIEGALVRYGFPLMATTAMTWCLGVSDRLFLQRTASATIVGNYSANYRLGSLVLLFVATPIALTWVPAARGAMSAHHFAQVLRRWLSAFLVVSTLLVVTLSLATPWLIPFFFGRAFTGDTFVVFLVSLSGLFGGLYYFAATPLLTSDDTRPLIAASIATLAVNLGLNALLISRYAAHGAAVATVLSYFSLTLITWRVALVRHDRRGARSTVPQDDRSLSEAEDREGDLD